MNPSVLQALDYLSCMDEIPYAVYDGGGQLRGFWGEESAGMDSLRRLFWEEHGAGFSSYSAVPVIFGSHQGLTWIGVHDREEFHVFGPFDSGGFSHRISAAVREPDSVAERKALEEAAERLPQLHTGVFVRYALILYYALTGRKAGIEGLYFEGERYAAHRMLRAAKNRFGSTNEIGMFEMVQSGLQEVTNPSAALIAGRPEGASGSCIVCTLEGTRPLLAEVQALVAKTAYGAARRMAAGIDYNRAVLLLAILEKRAGLLLSNYDSYINVVGGLRASEPAVDLAAAIAVASSYLEQTVDPHTAVFGEMGLSGEIRAVSGPSHRLREISRLGFSRCILPAAGCEDIEVPEGLEILPVRDIREAIRGAFRQSKPNTENHE